VGPRTLRNHLVSLLKGRPAYTLSLAKTRPGTGSFWRSFAVRTASSPRSQAVRRGPVQRPWTPAKFSWRPAPIRTWSFRAPVRAIEGPDAGRRPVVSSFERRPFGLRQVTLAGVLMAGLV